MPVALRVLAFLAFIAFLALTVAYKPPALADDTPVPLLVYQRHHPFLPTASTPMIRVYADGLVRIHRPAGHTRPGDYEMKLSDEELSRWLSLARQAHALSNRRAETGNPSDSRRVAGDEMLEINSDPSVAELYVENLRLLREPAGQGTSASSPVHLQVSSFAELVKTNPGEASESLRQLEEALLARYAAAGEEHAVD